MTRSKQYFRHSWKKDEKARDTKGCKMLWVEYNKWPRFASHFLLSLTSLYYKNKIYQKTQREKFYNLQETD
jgi:hypothetical protein